MKSDLISVIIPAYKAEKYINRCLNSVINQTYSNLEIIIVNDGSPDNTGKQLDEYALKDNRIKVIHKKNGGVSSARNAGLQVATGNYVCFVDIDDEIKPDYVKKLHNSLKKSNADIAICSILSEDKNNHFSKHGCKNELFIDMATDPNKLAALYRELFRPPYCKLYKKNLITNEFPEDINYGEDEIFNLHYFTNVNSIIVIPDDLYIYYHNNASLCRQNGVVLFKKRADTIKTKYNLLLRIFRKNTQLAAHFASVFTIRQLFGVIDDFLQTKKSSKEIISILNNIVLDEQIQFALKIYPHLDKKANIIWNCLTKKHFKTLVLLRKIKRLLKR